MRLLTQILAIFMLVAIAAVSSTCAEETALPVTIDFNQHIRPIFNRHCVACHGGVKQAGELSFVYEEQVRNVIEPGLPEDSYLIQRVVDEDDESRMPPSEHGPRLSEREVEMLKRWIEQGAKWARHWAYQTPKRHDAPALSDSDWSRQPIDPFVLAQLDARKIQPAPDEQPERWLRRVTLDLTGLPPTLEARSGFLSDLEHRGELAYEAVVDRLLASPRFGERWASVWFDQVRYADSRGQGEDSPRDIWKYRDWVIDALNRDLTYDEFTIKQIAGDLLPERSVEDHLATAVHRLTQTNEEGGTDDEEFRVASVLDRVNTTWQTWQGTSMGCVQCHSHPYDPIRHDEFYQSMAYFNNTADCDLSDDWPNLPVPLNRADCDKVSELDRNLRETKESLWRQTWQITHHEANWIPLRIDRASTSNATKVVVERKPTHDEYHTVGTVASGPQITVEMPLPDANEPITGIRVTALPLNPETALADAEVGFVMSNIKAEIVGPNEKSKPQVIEISQVVGDEPFPYSDPNESLKDNNEGFGAYSRVNYPRTAVLLLKSPLPVESGSRVVLKIKYRIFDLAAFILVARRGHFAVSMDPSLERIGDDPQLAKLNQRLTALQQERDAIESIATPVLNERSEHLRRPSHLFIRGLYLTKGDLVQPGVPASLHESQSAVSNRLEFARWLVSKDNPLTARVAVNRYWARMFGVGLVSTEEDFGSAGDPPSHPELLDDLAVRFRDDYGWSVKKLLREIALSRTYRQSSRIRPEIQDQDASNRWLARGPRHSLPAETIRDQMLAIGGLLSPKMHGPPVYPPLPPGVWKARRGTWKTPPVGEEDRYRRSVYAYVKRSVPFPTFATFDAPSRDVCMPKRLRSNTPLQPLMLLNDQAYVECAAGLAKRMVEHSSDLRKQMEFGFLAATIREPRPAEIEPLLELHDRVAKSSGEAVAMEAVAGVLLNLDEVIVK